jgi:PAS domain S-box-containing protein
MNTDSTRRAGVGASGGGCGVDTEAQFGVQQLFGSVDLLFDVLPVGLWACDTLGRIVGHNQRATELCGRAPTPGEHAIAALSVLRRVDGISSETWIAELLSSDPAEQSPARDLEVLLERDDGSRITLRIGSIPVRNEDGSLVGRIISFEDLSELRGLQSERLLDIAGRMHDPEVSRYLASIINSSNDAIISKDLNGIIRSWNQGAERLFGYTAEEAVGRSVTMLIPSDRQDEELKILRRIRHGELVDHYDTCRQRKDGALVDVSLAVSPVKDTHGIIVGASKIARDITDRKRAAEQRDLLIREMNHRTKNLFALTGSIVTLSARFAKTPQEVAKVCRERLSALARAHDLTLPDPIAAGDLQHRKTTLSDLITAIVLPFGHSADDHETITLNGPEIWISGDAMTGFALLLHEFATNAAKFGALSAPDGKIYVEWSVSGDELQLSWRECNGPRIEHEPQTDGFGSMLAKATIQGQLGGSIIRNWNPEGLTLQLTASLSRLSA